MYVRIPFPTSSAQMGLKVSWKFGQVQYILRMHFVEKTGKTLPLLSCWLFIWVMASSSPISRQHKSRSRHSTLGLDPGLPPTCWLYHCIGGWAKISLPTGPSKHADKVLTMSLSPACVSGVSWRVTCVCSLKEAPLPHCCALRETLNTGMDSYTEVD